jgi:hypothetical protein
VKLIFVAVIVLFWIKVDGQAGDRPLKGCARPEVLRTALANLHTLNWRTVSLDQVRSAWPAQLTGKECDSGGCREVLAQDRIISGHRECCAVFSFRVQGTHDQPRTEWLDNVIVTYSVMQPLRAVELAKTFADAMGLGPAEAGHIAIDSAPHFHWDTVGARGPELSAIEVRINQRGDLWEIYLNSAQNLPK